MTGRQLTFLALLGAAMMALCVSMTWADAVAVQTSKGKAYLTLTADDWGRGWVYDEYGNQMPDERPIFELYLCLERGNIQKWTAPEGWTASASGREITWWTEDPAYAVPFGGSLSGFSVKASGKGSGSWVTRAEDGSDIAFDYISLK